MEYETIRWIAIVSILANIGMGYYMNKVVSRCARIVLGGLIGIEKTVGNRPDTSRERISEYVEFCEGAYQKDRATFSYKKSKR